MLFHSHKDYDAHGLLKKECQGNQQHLPNDGGVFWKKLAADPDRINKVWIKIFNPDCFAITFQKINIKADIVSNNIIITYKINEI